MSGDLSCSFSLSSFPSELIKTIPRPNQCTHKYSRGFLGLWAGQEYPGSTILAARAAQRIGAGYVKIWTPHAVVPVFQISLPSVVTTGVKNTMEFFESFEIKMPDACVIGQGGGRHPSLREKILFMLRRDIKLVVDGDGLSVMEGCQSFFDQCARHPSLSLVLTPHEGEFKCLFNKHISDKIDKKEQAVQAAIFSKAIIVFKGAQTVIASPDGRTYIHDSACHDLATAGTGDVLSGMVGGFLAQGMDAFEAAVLGVWIHDQAAHCCGGAGMIAEDLWQALPRVVAQIRLRT